MGALEHDFFDAEVIKRLSDLDEVPEYKNGCICGRKDVISMIKVGVAQFFENASIERKVERIISMLRRVQHKTGQNATAIGRAKQICLLSVKLVEQLTVLISSSLLRLFDCICNFDMWPFLLLGSSHCKKAIGWPMGGAYSEPGTLIDLQHETRSLTSNSDRRNNVGWYVDNLTLNQTVTGVQHVDDSMLYSCMPCVECLYSELEKLAQKC